MKVEEYKKIMKKPIKPRTLVFVIDGDKVLLGVKKTGFGKGKWLGIGGKVEQGESVEEGAKREVQEEVGLEVDKLEKYAVVNFYFPHKEDESWNEEVHVFISHTWKGEVQETQEIEPHWTEISSIPYDLMWDDNHYWLPSLLENKKLFGEYTFGEDLKVVDYIHKPLV